MPMSKTYRNLNRALVRAGVPAKFRENVKGCELDSVGAVEVLVHSGIDASPYAQILLKYATELTVANEIEFVARCMMQRTGFDEAVPWLLSLFEGYPKNGLQHVHLWLVGHAIYTIDCQEYYPKVIAICRNKKYGSARKILMGTLARVKTDEAFKVLIACLDDPSVRAHAIEGLGRFGRVDAIPILEQLTVQKGLYEFKAKATALRRLYRKSDASRE
jgi:hypothetical protein